MYNNILIFQECSGSLLAKIIEIESEDNWWYESCGKCLKKVKKIDKQFYCEKCDKMVVAIPR